jgi:hypothetical protein
MPEKTDITAKLVDSLGYNGNPDEICHRGIRVVDMADDLGLSKGSCGVTTIKSVIYRAEAFSGDRRIEVPFQEYVRMGRPSLLKITGTGKYEPVRRS